MSAATVIYGVMTFLFGCLIVPLNGTPAIGFVIGAALYVAYRLGERHPVQRFIDWNWARAMYEPDPSLGAIWLWCFLHPIRLTRAAWRRRDGDKSAYEQPTLRIPDPE